MELAELYNKAVLLIEEVKKVSSQTSISGICVIVNNSGKIYAGTDGLKITDGAVSKSSPEYNAVLAMLADGNTIAEKMINIDSDGAVYSPSGECVEMLMNANSENVLCEVAVSADKSVKICELNSQPTAEEEQTEATAEEEVQPEPETPAVSETIEFSEEPVSDSMSFEEKFGFDFDDTPSTPVPTLGSDSNNVETVIQPDNNGVPQQVMPNSYPQQQPQQPVYPNNMSGQFVNMPSYPQPVQQGYPQQPVQSVYVQQGGYTQQSQFIQPNQQYMQSGQQIYAQPLQSNYSQQYNSQPVAQPISQQGVQYSNSQPLNSAYPQPQQPVSSHYINAMASSSQSVTLSGERKSKFRQRLNKFMDDDMTSSTLPQSPVAEESLSKGDIKKQARDKKKMAKVNADFKKRMKDLGY